MITVFAIPRKSCAMKQVKQIPNSRRWDADERWCLFVGLEERGFGSVINLKPIELYKHVRSSSLSLPFSVDSWDSTQLDHYIWDLSSTLSHFLSSWNFHSQQPFHLKHNTFPILEEGIPPFHPFFSLLSSLHFQLNSNNAWPCLPHSTLSRVRLFHPLVSLPLPLWLSFYDRHVILTENEAKVWKWWKMAAIFSTIKFVQLFRD